MLVYVVIEMSALVLVIVSALFCFWLEVPCYGHLCYGDPLLLGDGEELDRPGEESGDTVLD